VNRDEQKDLLLFYAAGLLEGAEMERARALLESGDPRAAGDFAEAQALLGNVSASIDPLVPPTSARNRLLDRVARDRRSLPGSRGTGSAFDPRLGAALAASLLLAAGLAWSLFDRTQARKRYDELAAIAAQRQNQVAQLQDLLGTAQLQLISFESQIPESKAAGRIFWDRQRNLWHMYVFDLAPPPEGREFELWFITPEQEKIPAGLFRVDASGSGKLTVQVPPGLERIALAAITDEPIGGSPQPTGTIRLVGKVE
jgi:hypothetical protein